MLKTFYIQLDLENRITDIIEIPHEEYIEVELNTPLPSKIMGGAYKLLGGQPIYIPDWDNDSLTNKISILEAKNSDLLLNIAIKDSKIQTIEKDLADLTLEVVMGGM